MIKEKETDVGLQMILILKLAKANFNIAAKNKFKKIDENRHNR